MYSDTSQRADGRCSHAGGFSSSPFDNKLQQKSMRELLLEGTIEVSESPHPNA